MIILILLAVGIVTSARVIEMNGVQAVSQLPIDLFSILRAQLYLEDEA